MTTPRDLPPETVLQIVEQCVRETEAAIRRQEKIIEELRRDGHPAIGAKTLLRLFERDLKEYQGRLELLRVAQR